MTVVINGTTGVSGVAGSASTPALIGSDADSGYYINSANEPNASVNGTAVWSAASSFGFKNRIINGAQVINQRNTTVTANSSTTTPFATDRWRGTNSATSTAFTMQQSSTAPAGFTYSLLCTVTNNTTPGSTGETEIFYSIEGYNVADMGFGAAGASTFTLSFWVNSSVTGTYGVGFESTSGAYNYVGTYTVNSANTWEQKTITVTGPTSGTFDKTNDRGLTLRFDLGSGSSYEQAAGSWVNSGASKNRTSSCVRWVTNSGATFYITGVQLEKGSTATSFDFRSYGTELALCQRYFSTSITAGTAVADGVGNGLSTTFSAYNTSNGYSPWIPFPVGMRAIPTITFYRGSPAGTNGVWQYYTGSWTSFTANTVASSATTGFAADVAKTSSFTTASSYVVTGNYSASAEL